MRPGLAFIFALSTCGGVPDAAWEDLTAPLPPELCPLEDNCGKPGGAVITTMPPCDPPIREAAMCDALRAAATVRKEWRGW